MIFSIVDCGKIKNELFQDFFFVLFSNRNLFYSVFSEIMVLKDKLIFFDLIEFFLDIDIVQNLSNIFIRLCTK